MTDTQRPQPVSVNTTVAQQQPNPIFLPDSGVARHLQSLHPKYTPQNPYAFRAQFLSNESFRNTYLDDVIGVAVANDPTLQEQIQKDPTVLKTAKNRMLSTYMRDLTRDASTGEEISEAIVNRASTLAGKDFPTTKVPEFQQLVQAFPENYVDFGLSDGKKINTELVSDRNAFGQMVRSDEKLRRQLYDDRFKTFGAKLSQSHNMFGVDVNNADDLAKAYAVYENYGSEGLTQYVNYAQKYDPTLELEAQPREVQQAHKFFNTADFSGRLPKEVIEGFIGSPDSPNGQLTYQPKTMSMEMNSNVPLDLNNFTTRLHTKGLSEGLAEMVSDKTFTPERTKGVIESINNGIPTKDSNDVLFDMMIKARNGDGWTMNDLANTVAVGAVDTQTDDQGVTRYVIDPNQLSPQAKMAMEALQMDNVIGARMFSQGEQPGTYLLEVGRQERLQTDVSSLPFYRGVNRQRVPIYDENANVVGFDEQFDPGLMGNLGLMVGRAGQFFTDYLFTPLTKFTAGALEVAGREDIARQITSSDFHQKLRDYADFDPYQETESFFGGGGVSLMAADLGMYIVSALNIGRMATATAGRAFAAGAGRASSAAYAERTMAYAGKFLQNAGTPTFAQARALKVANTLKNMSPHTTVLNMEIGAAALEGMGGANRSMLANPLFDSAFGAIGVQTDLEKLYATSDNMTRFGLDAMASVGIGIAFDNIWAGIKYGGNLRRASKGKTSKGLRYVDETNEYEQVATPQFAPEWRRFLYNTMNGLQEMPLGNLADSNANLFLGRAVAKNPDNITTLSDAMALMNKEYSSFFSALKEDTEKAVRHWDEQFGGKIRYSEGEIEKRTDKLYQETIDKIADGIVRTYSAQDPTKTDLLRVMVGAMNESGGSVRSLAYYDTNEIRFTMNAEEANSLMMKEPNTFVTPITQSDGSTAYTVNKIDEGFWGFRLGQAITKRSNEQTVQDVIDKNLRLNNIDTNNLTPEQVAKQTEITEKANTWVGREVIHNNERGYVTGFDNEGLTVRTVDGNEYTGVDISIRTLNEPIQWQQPLALLPEGTRRVSDDESVRLIREYLMENADAKELLTDLDSGLPFDSALARMRQMGIPETEVRAVINGDFESQIAQKTQQIQRISSDKRIKNEELRITKMQEVQDELDVIRQSQGEMDTRLAQAYKTGSTVDEANAARLAKQTEEQLGGDPIKTLTRWWSDAHKKKKKAASETRLVMGKRKEARVPGGNDAFREAYGIGRGVVNQVRQTTKGAFEATKNSARSLVMALGADNNLVDNVAKVAYNKGEIKIFVPQSDVKKGTLVVDSGQLYMARGNMKGEAMTSVQYPTTWIQGMDGKLHQNPYWARVEPNATINDVTGQLTPYVQDSKGIYGTIYRPATAGDRTEDQVFLNVQRLSKDAPPDLQTAFEKEIDGIVTTKAGQRYIEVFNPEDQAIAINKAHLVDGTLTERRKEIIKMMECK